MTGNTHDAALERHPEHGKAAHTRQLDESGWVVLPDFCDAAMLAEMRERVRELFDAEGENAGAEFKQEAGCLRLANLADKGEVFRRAMCDPRLLELVEVVLGHEFKISSINARSILPHSDTTQPLHCDMAAVPDERGFWVCNSVWMLDDFTPDNGPIRVVPGSHRSGSLPQAALADPTAPHPDEVHVTGRAGTVGVMNAHLWHGGLPNRTDQPRTAVHVFFCRRDKPQQQIQRDLLRSDTLSRLNPLQRRLLAVDDEPVASGHARSGFLK